MNLNVYKTLSRNSTTSPRITFGYNGRISLNMAATSSMGVKDGNCILLANDQDNPQDWYFKITEDVGITLYRKDSQSSGSKMHMVKLFYQSLGMDIHTSVLPIGEKNEEGWYPIITRAIMNNDESSTV